MNSQEYIASGMLELYAAGSLSEADRREVEKIAAEDPVVAAELQAACNAMEQYAAIHAIKPRPKVKAKLMHRLEELKRKQLGANASANGKETGSHHVFPAPELHFNHKKRDKYKWLVAATFTLLILSNILSFYFYQRWKRTENKLQDAGSEQLRMATHLNTTNLKIAQLQTAVVVLEDEQMKRVKLAGQDKSPASLAIVHWNPKTKIVFLELKQLPLPPDGRQYQLWALYKGKPANAGLVDSSISLEGMQQMEHVNQAQAFAITLEPVGGSPKPTMQEMYLMGSI